MNDVDFPAWMGQMQRRTEAALARHLPRADVLPEQLHEAMRYATLGGGKRVRALLAHAAGAVTDAAPDRVDVVASAVELIHAYSLVHDDMPCMDNDVLRRGKPTAHGTSVSAKPPPCWRAMPCRHWPFNCSPRIFNCSPRTASPKTRTTNSR